jgi:hypothetical protein
MKKYIISTFIAMSILFTAVKPVSAQTDKPNEEVPPAMYGFLSHILELQPMLYSREEFSSDKNQKFVSRHLQDVVDLSQELKKHKRLQTPGFKVPADIIVKELHDVNDAYKNGHRDFAWRSLRSTLHKCSQCHTQVSQVRPKLLWTFDQKNLPTDPMEQGDFWFMIRYYENAFAQFSKVVSSYGKTHNDQFKLKKALKYIMTICLRIDQSPDKAMNYLEKLPNQKVFPKYLSDEIRVWKNELLVLTTLPPINPRTIAPKEMEKYVDDLLRSIYPIPREGRSKDIASRYASGLLFDFANHRSKEVTQRMYFWLGVSSQELDKFEVTSFGDPYLKDCIEKFPPNPISEECYIALEDDWIFGYSGSAGTFLPQSNKNELQRLKTIIEKKK